MAVSEELDRAVALSLQEAFNRESSSAESNRARTSQEEGDDLVILGESKADTSSLDYVLAISLQEDFARIDGNDDSSRALATSLQQENESQAGGASMPTELLKKRYDPMFVVDSFWEKADPTPDVHALFTDFDAMFFSRTLVNAGVAVSWGPRMTLCAGLCCYEGRGGLCAIKLSEPLLKLRPRRDLVETLLHEMIHAYLFVTAKNKNHDAHGPEFCKHMTRINSLTGARITVYHNFNEEVKLYQQHVWKCDGRCQHKPPFYGILRRASNRAPSPRDSWWSEHQATCGGEFVKFSEPEGYKKSRASKKKAAKGKVAVKGKKVSKSSDIKKLLEDTGAKPKSSDSSLQTKGATFSGEGYSLGKGTGKNESYSDLRSKMLEAAEKRQSLSQGGVATSHTSINSNSLIKTALGGTLMKRTAEPAFRITGAKKLKLSDDDAIGGHHSSADSGIIDLVCSPLSAISEDSLPRSSQLSPHVVTEPGGGGATGSDVMDITTNSPPYLSATPTGTCPVCGRADIPSPVVNTHVAYCLEEMELMSDEEIC